MRDGGIGDGWQVRRASTALVGRWPIVEMDLWAQEDVDLVAPGFIEFERDHMGAALPNRWLGLSQELLRTDRLGIGQVHPLDGRLEVSPELRVGQ